MFETSPIFSPCARSSASTGSVSSKSSKLCACSQARVISTAAFVGSVGIATHPADDPLGEEHPDLLVVIELRVPLHGLDRSGACLRVPSRVELEPETPPEKLVSLRPKVGPRFDEREVDVEEDCPDAHAGAGQRYASGRRCESDGSRRRTSSSQARSSSAEITVSSSGACASTVPHGSTISERP